MKIVILGASGFIGKNLNADLSNMYDVNGVSLRKPGWKNNIGEADTIINLIGKAHDHKGTATESDYYYVNVGLLKDIFKEFINSAASLFIHISSLAAVEEYESNHPLDEEAACNPFSFYGKSKREAEKWLLAQPLPANKKIIIIRPPMVHGPGDKGNLGLLYKLISKGVPYPLSSFDNKRSFVSIGNFIFFIQEIVSRHAQLKTGIYHIADDESMSTKEIINSIKYITGKNVPDLALPKMFVKFIAILGDVLPIPLNTKRLKKMTSNLLVSNAKIKKSLGLEKLPLSANEGLIITIKSFNQAK